MGTPVRVLKIAD